MKRITLAFLISLFSSGLAFSAPSDQIQKMLATPASIFDVYLMDLYVNNSCDRRIRVGVRSGSDIQDWLDGKFHLLKPNRCLTTIPSYSFSDNVITVFVGVYKHDEIATILSKKTKEEDRKKSVKKLLNDISVWVGTKGCSKGVPADKGSGVVFRSKIRRGWKTEDTNTVKMKCEIAKRIRLEVWLHGAEERLAKVLRKTHRGEISF